MLNVRPDSYTIPPIIMKEKVAQFDIRTIKKTKWDGLVGS